MSECKTCGAEIRWADTVSGKIMPLDAKPDPKGLFVVVSGIARKATDEDDRLLRNRYTSHFANCKQAAQHRRPR